MYIHSKNDDRFTAVIFLVLAVAVCIALSVVFVYVRPMIADVNAPIDAGETVTLAPQTTQQPPQTSEPPQTTQQTPQTSEPPQTTAQTTAQTTVQTTAQTTQQPQTTVQTTAKSTTTGQPPVATNPPRPVLTGESVLGETADAGQEYQDKIVFLGDSTTYSFLYYGVLKDGKNSKQVWTPSSRTLTLDGALTTKILYPETDTELSLKSCLEKKQPEIFVITLGVNGIAYMDETYFKKVYTALVEIVQEASPSTYIILQSIFPVARNWEKTKSINNTKINTANEWILDIATDCGVYYLDTNSVLATENGGYLPIDAQNGDGLHLNKDACNLVLDYIRTHAIPDFLP